MRQRSGYSREKRATEVGAYLTSLRTNQRLTQQRVADMLGKSRSYLCQIETGKRTPHPSMLRRLAGIYGVLPEEVLRKAGLLELPFLDAIIAPAELPTDPLQNVTEAERLELIRYLAFLRLSRPTATM